MNELLQPFKSPPAGVAAYVRLAEFLQTAVQDRIDGLALEALSALPDGGTFLDQAWSFVSHDGLRQAADRSLAILESGQASEAAESALAHVSLQASAILQPYLPRLFRLAPNARSYCENWPWRGALPSDLPFLASMLASTHAEDRQKAWLCLLETRRPEALADALKTHPSAALPHPVHEYFLEVGYRTPQERLYPASCAHFVFPKGYFLAEGPAWNRRGLHPTWRLEVDDDGPFRFGGEGTGMCGVCGQKLHHLVSLPSTTVFDGPSAGSTLPLEVCLSCLGWERDTLSYRHAADGRIDSLDTGPAQPEFVSGPLRETLVHLALTPDRWHWQDWGMSNSRENLNRVGGYPSWIQSSAYPDCPSCGATMQFLLQLDSELPTADGQEWLWGSGGICYSFRCSPCRVTTHRWQCT